MTTHHLQRRLALYPPAYRDLKTGELEDFQRDTGKWITAVGVKTFFNQIDASDMALAAVGMFVTENADAFDQAFYEYLVEPVNEWLRELAQCA